MQLAFDLWGLQDTPDVSAVDAEPSPPATSVVVERPEVDPAPITAPRRVPTATGSRVDVGVEVSELVQRLVHEGRRPDALERARIAQWPGWGASPELFNEGDPRYAAQRDRLREVWTDQEWSAARRTVLNAHYTAPEYASAIWDAVVAAGFPGGQVLEPGCGRGVFIETAPSDVQMTGVELDSTTATIASLLHPHARILAESFADTVLEHDGYDAVVGNVPFGKISLFDPEYNPRRLSLHNHFIVKSLRMTRPGGIVAVLTSRFTLDAKDDTARRAIAEHGALLGAVRLPTNAHHHTAGTDVVTDLLILRRHLPDQVEQSEPTWLTTSEAELPGGRVRVNDYFDVHPEHVLGQMTAVSGRFGPEVAVATPTATPAAVATALREVAVAIAARAMADGHGWAATGHIATDRPRPASRGGHDHPIGHLGLDADGTIWAQGVGGRQPVAAPPKVLAEVRRLIRVRDTATGLLELEARTSGETESVAAARIALGEAYDAYAGAYGPLSRMVVKVTGRVDEDGEPIVRRVYPPAIQVLRGDPAFATVAALENYDEETGAATRADIFTRRVVGAAPAAVVASSADDAIAISLDRLGRIEPAYIAELLDCDAADLQDRLAGLVFLDPEHANTATTVGDLAKGMSSGGWVSRADYLSGDVRHKLKIARTLAFERPEFQANVDALTAVQPVELGPAEIDVTPNAAWLPDPVIRGWLATITGKDVVAERIGGRWKIRIRGAASTIAEQRYSTEHVSVQQVLTRVLNGDDLKVTREITVGETVKRVVDPEATAALVEVAEAVTEHFGDWIWADPERADALQERYNDLFNGIVLRSYDGVCLSLPGKAAGFQPRPHQHAAVARMIHEPSCGLFHEVGAGKTAEMVMGVMELRRLGMASKPAVIVPNHMLEQFTREFKQIYPAAKVLAAGGADVARSGGFDGRQLFVAKAAVGDWDAVILTQNAFTRIGLGPDSERAYLQARRDEYLEQLEQMRQSTLSKDTVKTIEAKIARFEERLKALTLITRDDGITFEQTGIDYLCIDEAHGYKNLAVETSVDDLQKAKGSQKATDLEMKLWYLRELLGRDRVCTLATATPIANSMIEMYVMQRYIRPDLLHRAEVYSADAWAAQFTRQVPAVEQTVAGEFRMITRTAAFRNIPELLKLWHTSADVKTAADLNLPVPLIAERAEDGQRTPEVVSVPATAAQKALIDQLVTRAEAVRMGMVQPTEDNMLKISSDGRTIAMDARLLDEALVPQTGEQTKIGSAAAPRIARIWETTKQHAYLKPDGTPAAMLGALQIVFADRGTPSDKWNAYDALRHELTKLGMPAEQIRFMHDAATEDEKAGLFAACRDGRVAVIVGSTERMGTGTNIQHRAIALHHLDCPWRPADVTQREGRIVRQHNQNPEVQVIRYVTKGSFDGYMWQTVTRKATFIEQVLAGKLDVREMDDIGESTLSFAEVAAIAADDMRILEKAQLESEVTKLRRAQRAYGRGQTAARARLMLTNGRIQQLEQNLDAAEDLLTRRIDTRGDAFTATLTGSSALRRCRGEAISDRREFGEALLTLLRDRVQRSPMPNRYNPGPRSLDDVALTVGALGFAATVRDTTAAGGSGATITLQLEGVDIAGVEVPVTDLGKTDALALAQRLERRVTGLGGHAERWSADRAAAEHDVADLQRIIDTPWTKADEFATKATRLDELVRELAHDGNQTAELTTSDHGDSRRRIDGDDGPAAGLVHTR